MPARFLYYIPCVAQLQGRVGFFSRILETDAPLNTEERVRELIVTIRREYMGDDNAEEVPVIPLSWTLITAQSGAVAVQGDGDSPA